MAAAAPLVTALVLWARKRRSVPPEELERRRRASLNARGKMGDANLLEFRDDHLFYSYDVGGMEYTATQDISALKELLPADPATVSSTVYVKYDPKNPADSIILCEEWSGLRAGAAARRRSDAAAGGG